MTTVTVNVRAADGAVTALTVTLPPVTAPSGFPDATNTGVTPGTVLKNVPADVSSGPGWVWNKGGWVDINSPCTFDGFSVQSSVNVNSGASGSTVSNCRIVNTGNDNGVGIRHANNVTVKNCTISGATAGGADNNRLTSAVKDVYGDTSGHTVTGNNIFDCSGGITIDDGLIEDNYIHDMGYNSADHLDCLQSFSGAKTQLTIRHNTLLNAQGQTSCLLLQFAGAGNVLVDDNLVAGGGYCFYGGDTATNIKFTNNKISTRYFAQGGQFGTIAHWQPGNAGNVWSGNTWFDGPNAGQTV